MHINLYMHSGSTLNGGGVAGIVVGLAVLSVLVLLLALLVHRRRREKNIAVVPPPKRAAFDVFHGTEEEVVCYH